MKFEKTVIDKTQKWLNQIVIGLNFCPFAKVPFLSNKVRFFVSASRCSEALLTDLQFELQLLAQISPQEIETTLVIHPQVLNDFFEFNDFLAEVESLVEKLELGSFIQIASFHPQYLFAGESPQALSHYTNRSPYPTIHLLRAESVTRAIESYPQVHEVPQRNIVTLKKLGKRKFFKLFQH